MTKRGANPTESSQTLAKVPTMDRIDNAMILDSLPACVVLLDRHNTINTVNAAGEIFFQSSKTSLMGKNLQGFLPFSSPALELVERARKHNSTIWDYRVDVSSPRLGKQVEVDICASAITDHADEVLVMFIRRTVADKIDRQLNHRDAARTVTGLAEMLAHEIKNPLSGIKGAAQLLEANLSANDQKLTQLITQETDRIANLVARMEAFSDVQIPQRDPINIHSVLEHVRKLAESGFGSGVKFVERYDPSIPPVFANRDQLVQVVLNLVKNACEAMENQKQKTITLSSAYRSGVRIATGNKGKKVALPIELTVADNGPGIPPSIEDHIFDPFVTTKINGSGLGLALVSKIISAHGGVIDIGPHIRKGSQVRILLPAYQS